MIFINPMKHLYFFESTKNSRLLPRIMLSLAISIIFANILSLSESELLLPSSYAQNSLATNTTTSSNNSNNNNNFIQTYDNNNNNFTTLRTQYLAAWHKLNFSSSSNTFIVPQSDKGYGIYQSHNNTFSPGQDIVLYVEPIGFAHQQINDNSTGNIIYAVNISVAITISDKLGNELASFGAPLPIPYSHHQNTEVYFAVTIHQHSPFPAQEYVAKYVFTDNVSGKEFTLTKDFTISK